MWNDGFGDRGGLNSTIPFERAAACRKLGESRDVRAVESLVKRLRDHYPDVQYAAFQALESIVEALDFGQLFCRRCLARFGQQEHHLKGVGTVSIPVCRLCRRAAHAMLDVEEVVAVLDTEMGLELSFAHAVIRASYLGHNAPFDFDRVEIARAGDYEVERFCVQVGNDADPFRRGRYRQMRCLVSEECNLSENTMRILGSMFGQVLSRAQRKSAP
jgi:hypothetical protein